MSASDDTDWISRLNNLSEIDSTSGALTRLLFLPIVAFFVELANLTESIFNLAINPLSTLGNEVSLFISNTIGGSAEIIGVGARVSNDNLGIFGIGAFPVSVGIGLSVFLIIAWYLGRDESSDILPGTFTDLPLIGVDEDEE
jgi:fucose permease